MVVWDSLEPDFHKDFLRSMASLKNLQQKIGYTFKDVSLLKKCLEHPSCFSSSHKSKGPSWYQRAEFLGDRVLGLVIANWLYDEYVKENEGELARRFNGLVRKETLSEIGLRIDIGPFIQMAEADIKQGERENPGILADATEALIAALYLDGGLPVAEKFIKTYWKDLISCPVTSEKDAKSTLQEWTQAQGKELPRYVLLKEKGPAHAPEFLVEVTVEGVGSAEGQSNTKRGAEQVAAEKILEDLSS